MENKKYHIGGCILFFLLALLTTISVHGQVGDGSQPLSFSNATVKAQVPEIVMPSFDANGLLQEDAVTPKDVPFRFGNSFDVSLNLNNSGIWETLSNGDRIWRLSIKSSNAYSINLVYDQFYLPTGAKLHIYNYAKDYLIGGFSSTNNKASKKFATQPVKGEGTILEYYEPLNVQGQGMISISKVVHAYKDMFNKQVKVYGESGACNNNINCPEGAPWQNEKRGVAMILLSGGNRICTGCLVNNVNQDATQFFLTANHCLGGEDTWIFMFNYESPTCTNQDGPTNQTVQGSSLLATNTTSDFALLRITETIPSSYRVYYNGWSNESTAAQSAVGIHHPSGDIKKVSFENHPLQSRGFWEGNQPYDGQFPYDNSHWYVSSWEDGVTEGGSSGSPLFDQKHRIVGQLHGGPSSCSATVKADYYGKIAVSWNGGGTSATRLRDWLDPNNTGASTLDGFDPIACNADWTISQNISGGTVEFLASNSIVASNIISAGATVHYGANNSVRMTPGFKVNANCSFRGDLKGCTGSSLKSSQSGESSLAEIEALKSKEVTIEDNVLKVYPNPNDGIFTIETKNDLLKQVVITDLKGSEVYRTTITSGIQTLNLSNVAKGIYVMKIIVGEDVKYEKLVIK